MSEKKSVLNADQLATIKAALNLGSKLEPYMDFDHAYTKPWIKETIDQMGKALETIETQPVDLESLKATLKKGLELKPFIDYDYWHAKPVCQMAIEKIGESLGMIS